mmetsp:Transcript_6438/g.9384  ORF Transcript_6438/g.9384 Transcript_6438/m.9384 type:complete len:230 (+) Transcript_6438:695-1384(+)
MASISTGIDSILSNGPTSLAHLLKSIPAEPMRSLCCRRSAIAPSSLGMDWVTLTRRTCSEQWSASSSAFSSVGAVEEVPPAGGPMMLPSPPSKMLPEPSSAYALLVTLPVAPLILAVNRVRALLLTSGQAVPKSSKKVRKNCNWGEVPAMGWFTRDCRYWHNSLARAEAKVEDWRACPSSMARVVCLSGLGGKIAPGQDSLNLSSNATKCRNLLGTLTFFPPSPTLLTV